MISLVSNNKKFYIICSIVLFYIYTVGTKYPRYKIGANNITVIDTQTGKVWILSNGGFKQVPYKNTFTSTLWNKLANSFTKKRKQRPAIQDEMENLYVLTPEELETANAPYEY